MKPLQALVAAAAVSFAGAAQAVPIAFEFSGIVQVSTRADWSGQLATGLFLIETDNFTVLPTPPPTVTWTDVLPFDARPEPIGASLTIGSDLISLNDAVETYGGIHFNGDCAPSCSPGWADTWSISGNTQSFPLGGQPGPDGYNLSSLLFSSRGPSETDFIPGSGLTPLDILTLPLDNLLGSYTSWDTVCPPDSGECFQTNYTTAQFQVTSLTRVVQDPTAVPEPGTLGLLAAALVALAFLRRRKGEAAKRGTARLAPALAACALASTAQAVPVYIDFTGTVLSTSEMIPGFDFGAPVSGGFNLDTDRLFRSEAPGTVSLVDWMPPVDPALPLAFLSSPAVSFDLPHLGGTEFITANFNYPCFEAGCEPLPVNGLTLMASSSQRPELGVPADFTGSFITRDLLLFGSYSFPDGDRYPADIGVSSLFDGNFDFLSTFAFYSENTVSCVLGICDGFESHAITFSVDSLTRGEGPRASVPEPGTLVLFAAGLLALGWSRRRRLI